MPVALVGRTCGPGAIGRIAIHLKAGTARGVGFATIDHRRGDHRDGGGHDDDSNNRVDHRGHASGGAGGSGAGVVGFARLPCYSAIGLGRAMVGADHTRLGPADTGFAVHTCGPAVAVVAAWLVAITSDQLLADHSVAALVSGRLGQLAIGDQPGLRLSGQVPTDPVTTS